MVKALLFVLVTLVSALPASAQVIHGDPQKAAYASPVEWPTISSQCHWRAPNIGGMPGMPAHTHVDLTFPLFAEMGGGPFIVPLKITLFNTTGQINRDDIGGTANAVVVMDTPFPLIGDPLGVKVFTGTVTFNLTNSGLALHGWQPIQMLVRTHYTNGDILHNRVLRPLYSMVDPTAPLASLGDGTGIRDTSSCFIDDRSDPQNLGQGRWQQNAMEFLQILPVLGPITPGTPWRMISIAYNYGATTGLPPGIFELRVDPDLHNGIPGTIIDSVQGGDTTISAVTLPDNVPDGIHKLMWMWRRPNMAGDKELDSLMVFTVTVGPGGAPQPANTSQVPAPGSGAPPPPVSSAGLALTVNGGNSVSVSAGTAYTLAATVKADLCHNITLDGIAWTTAWPCNGSPLVCVNNNQTRTATVSRTHVLAGHGTACAPISVLVTVSP